MLVGGPLFFACSNRQPIVPPVPIPWVDPSRCLAPCSGPSPGSLVTVNSQGELSRSGRFRIVKEAQPGLQALLQEAKMVGLSLWVNGAYRTHVEQEAQFSKTTEVGRFARPGHSEHELGVAVDLDYPGNSAESFLLARGPTYGFLTSYPARKEHLTGFRHEPWHQRFVGVQLAEELTRRGLSLQEYLDQDPTRGHWGDCSDCSSPLARAPCASEDAGGRCDGAILRWCWRGAAAAVDCSSSGGHCDSASLRCIPAQSSLFQRSE